MFNLRNHDDIAIVIFNCCYLSDPKNILSALSLGHENTTKFIFDLFKVKLCRNKKNILSVILEKHNYFKRIDGGIVVVFEKIINLQKEDLIKMGIPVAQKIRTAVKVFEF